MSAQFDPKLVERLSREGGRVRSAPDLASALDQCSKQFQLWDVTREEFDPTPAHLDRIERIRPLESAGPGFQAVAADCTKEVVRLTTASTLAGKGYATFRTLQRIAFKKPYKTGD